MSSFHRKKAPKVELIPFEVVVVQQGLIYQFWQWVGPISQFFSIKYFWYFQNKHICIHLNCHKIITLFCLSVMLVWILDHWQDLSFLIWYVQYAHQALKLVKTNFSSFPLPHPHFSPEIFILFAEEKMAKANWGNGRVLVKAFGSYTCWNFAYV